MKYTIMMVLVALEGVLTIILGIRLKRSLDVAILSLMFCVYSISVFVSAWIALTL